MFAYQLQIAQGRGHQDVGQQPPAARDQVARDLPLPLCGHCIAPAWTHAFRYRARDVSRGGRGGMFRRTQETCIGESLKWSTLAAATANAPAFCRDGGRFAEYLLDHGVSIRRAR